MSSTVVVYSTGHCDWVPTVLSTRYMCTGIPGHYWARAVAWRDWPSWAICAWARPFLFSRSGLSIDTPAFLGGTSPFFPRGREAGLLRYWAPGHGASSIREKVLERRQRQRAPGEALGVAGSLFRALPLVPGRERDACRPWLGPCARRSAVWSMPSASLKAF